MKKALFWLTCPVMFVLFGVVGCVGALCEVCTEACHLWEAWCFDYGKCNPDMKYVGDGIWVSKIGLGTNA